MLLALLFTQPLPLGFNILQFPNLSLMNPPTPTHFSQPPVKMVIAGASKSGTTALYYYLKQHPQLAVPERKEVHYFSRPYLERAARGPGDAAVIHDIPRTLAAYGNLYRRKAPTQIGVDVSPSYLYYHECATAIRDTIDPLLIVCLLRNPAEKAFSQYVHLVSEARETLSFTDALAAEPKRREAKYGDMWLYRASGYYSSSVKHFQTVFGATRTAFYYSEEFMADPFSVLSDICSRLAIDDTFVFSPVSPVNPTGTPRSKFVAKALAPSAFTSILRRLLPAAFAREMKHVVKSANSAPKPAFPPALRAQLLDEFADEIYSVEQLVGRPSNWWATKEATDVSGQSRMPTRL